MIAERPLPERDFRGPGCAASCEVVRAIVTGRFGRSELLLHDPVAHERYGRITAGSPDEPLGAVIRIGPLAIDRDHMLVTVDGEHVFVTPREWEILWYLAIRRGRVCSTAEIAMAIWGDWYATNSPRVLIARVRNRLGSAAWVLQNRVGFGYLLDDRPVAVVKRAGWVVWAAAWDACVCCGRRDRRYFAHGRCERCRFRSRSTRQHYGPCGPPPAVER